MARSPRGLTLMELLVATALGVVLIGIITFVWLQSNELFSVTVNRIQAHQQLRQLLDQLERDLANTRRTASMEFFQDHNNNGIFDDGSPDYPPDALQTHGAATAEAPPPAFRSPISDQDPLLGETEFNEEGNPENVGISSWPFFPASLIFSPPPYTIQEGTYTDERLYWRDEIYVRSFVRADGINRPALVHYRLVQRDDGRSALRRRIWFRNPEGRIVAPPGDPDEPSTDRVSLLASNVCELKFGFFYKKAATDEAGGTLPNGYWYHVGQPASVAGEQRVRDLLDQDQQEDGYVNALSGAPRDPNFALSRKHLQGEHFPGRDFNACMFSYQGTARVEMTKDRKVVLRTIDDVDAQAPTGDASVSTQNDVYTNFQFSGVRPGDRIYLYGARDDDDQHEDLDWVTGGEPPLANDPRPVGSGGTGVENFPDGFYTVKAIESSAETWVAVNLREPIRMSRLIRNWLGTELNYTFGDGESIPAEQDEDSDEPEPNDMALTDSSGPEREVVASFNVNYRMGFLPSAFRVRMSVDDKRNNNIVPLERVIRLLHH